jgi:pyrimidine-nucleoside phosphorylase
MLIAETIRTKRDGNALAPEVIEELIRAYAAGEIPDYQMAALLMTVYFQGLDERELAAWAGAMLHSGEVVDLSAVPGGKVDKHSTGGVGDKVSIPLAPLVAACGVRVPMISGRGLGHTGGTLDKLESIPGFRTDLPVARFVEGVATVGACMIGQTDTLVPADRRMYALRDVTGTVESIPLISASIMSKKLAEGVSGLVLDVKVGSGAFMKTVERARDLARTMVGIGTRHGVKTVAYLTSMSQPIGWAVGNALEVAESIEVLRGEGPDDTTALVVTLGGRMLVLGGAAATQDEGEAAIRRAIETGAGLARFRDMVAFQGGDVAAIDETSRLPRARSRRDVPAPLAGYVTGIDCEKVGLAALVVGGGRRRKEDVIDPAVGLRVRARLGARVEGGDPLATIEYDDPAHLDDAHALVARAYRIGDEPPADEPLVIDIVE